MPYSNPYDPLWDELLDAAWCARANAYAPYSHFHVGAALRFQNGAIHSGCNVESASYGATICAERNAMCAAVASGLRPGELSALVVVTEAEMLTPPCGICRQLLVEFADKLPILLANRNQRALHDLAELLPHAFSGRNL